MSLKRLKLVQEDLGDCRRCGLCQTRKNIVFGTGDPDAALMFVGEYVYRRIRHSDFPHASLLDGIRAYSNDTAPSPDSKCAGTRA